jgi:hypothetical protein
VRQYRRDVQKKEKKQMRTKQRVKQGMAYLDKAHPGWEDEIDLTILDLTSPIYCVLGQLHGNFFDYMRGARIGHDAVVSFGFANYGTRGYRRLTTRWKKAIKNRQKQKLVLVA